MSKNNPAQAHDSNAVETGNVEAGCFLIANIFGTVSQSENENNSFISVSE